MMIMGGVVGLLWIIIINKYYKDEYGGLVGCGFLGSIVADPRVGMRRSLASLWHHAGAQAATGRACECACALKGNWGESLGCHADHSGGATRTSA